MIKVQIFVFNDFQENTFVLSDETKECIIIDAGCYTDAESEKLKQYIQDEELIPKKLINTHCHVDHIFGNLFVKKTYNVPYYIHKEEMYLINNAQKHAVVFGLHMEVPPQPDEFITEGMQVKFGKSKLEIIHLPGHSKGSIALYSKEDKFIISGDVLFYGSIGRTDLPGGDFATLVTGIKQKLLSLPREVVVYPGHGPTTTIQQEHDTNPFLQT